MSSSAESKLSFSLRMSLLLMGLASLIAILYVCRPVIVPLIGATLVGIMLSPLVDFMTRKKMNRIVAISITLFLGILVLASLITLISTQITGFQESMPQMKQNILALYSQIRDWISSTFGVGKDKVDGWFNIQNFVNTENAAMGKTLMSVGNMLVLAVLLPVYVFLILYYKSHLVSFVHKLFGSNDQEMVSEVLSSIKTTIKSYLVGLMLEALLVGTLYSLGLFIIGIQYAILLGVLAALLNIIPYVGQIVAGSLSVFIALSTKTSPTYALIVLGLFMLIQFIDNNFFLPRIVASKVKLNALVSIAVVIMGNLLWGVPGMFLAIPLTAICKVIFDEIDYLRPWGFLLGEAKTAKELGVKKK